jgi:hypothetical protein
MNIIQEDVGIPDVFSRSGVVLVNLVEIPPSIKEGLVSWPAMIYHFSHSSLEVL